MNTMPSGANSGKGIVLPCVPASFARQFAWSRMPVLKIIVFITFSNKTSMIMNKMERNETNKMKRRVYYVYDSRVLEILKNINIVRKRAFVVHSLIRAYNLLTKCEMTPVEIATDEDLSSFHCPEYLTFLQGAQNSSLNGSKDSFSADDFNLGYDCPLFENMYTFVQLIAGSSLSAAKKLVPDVKNDGITNNSISKIDIIQPKSYLKYKYENLTRDVSKGDIFELPPDLNVDDNTAFMLNVDIEVNTKKKIKYPQIQGNGNVLSKHENSCCDEQNIAINWFGGWHHAQRDGAEGFCYVNDIVIAIQFLLKTYKKILYVDLDIHHGNGVENAFLFSPRVFVMSIHKYESGFYPASGSLDDVGKGNGKFYTANIPLKDGITDDVYLQVFTIVTAKVLKKYKPECIVVQCGADCISGDPLGGFNLTPVALGECLRLLLNENLPTLLLGGGGYNVPNTAKCWAYLTSIVLDCSLSNDIPENSYFHLFGPSFELASAPTLRRNENSEEYIKDFIYGKVRQKKLRQKKKEYFGKMMKISKPVLMNDFTFSHVQFTSLNLVNFKNIKPVYNGNEKILLEFEHPSKAEISCRDWIGIFPRGWTNLQQYVTFEWISQSVISSNSDPNKEDGEFVRRTIVFCPKYHMNCVNQSALYQFVYVGKQIEVLGVSSYFRFDLTCLTDSSLEIECLVPVTGKVCSASVSDLGTLSMTNDISSTSIDSGKLIHTSSVHSLQNLDSDGKLSWSRMNFTDDKKNMCLMKRASILTSGTGDSLDPYSSHSEPVFPMSLPLAQCKKCYQFKRGGEFLRSQQVLQSKVGPCFEEASLFVYNRRMLGNEYFLQDKLKIVMERNKILEERAQEMKKGLERLQGESKRMKMLYYNVNKEKIAYEKFVKDFIKSLEKDSIVRVLYGNTEILVKKVNYVGMEEHPRDKKTSKKELELKAVIGLQEITIKNLINSLQEKAKSVEELNQTLKLAQVFSVAGTESRDLQIGGEESTDEFSNSDITSEYEFSLPKPSPPEEVSQDTDDVLDKIRRKSEIELKNIGITRSLGDSTQPDVEVPNLSIMTLDSDKNVPKRPRLVDNVEDCWPVPRNPSRTFKQTLLESNVSLTEETINISKDGLEINNEISMVENNITRAENIKDGEIDVDTTTCEDYYDACEALSVRSFSPESETVEVVQRNESLEPRELTKDTKNILEEGVKSFQVEENQKNKIDEISEQNATGSKFSKFTCELSIDFVQKRSHSDQRSGNLVCSGAQNNSGLDLVALCQPEIEEQKMCSIERDKSLITLRKSNKCLEIKITKIDPKETSVRSVHQKMVVQFTGCKIDKEENLTEECECFLNANCPEFSGEENTGNVCSEPEVEEDESASVAEAEQINEEAEGENTEVDVFSPRTEWNDALENEYAEKADTSLEEENKEQELQEPPTETLTATGKEMELKDNEYEIPQQCLTSKCDNQISTEDSMKNSKTYQDSLRYEKNLQFLNNKSEGKDRESDDETLKEKPSAILIQSGQSKVAVIRYQ